LGVQARDDVNNRGARIAGVTDSSPAVAAGLSVGALITKVDEQVIESADALVAAVQSKPSGARTSLGFVDNSGDRRTVVVTLGTDQGRQESRPPLPADEASAAARCRSGSEESQWVA
jgi:putative serine protease PepD